MKIILVVLTALLSFGCQRPSAPPNPAALGAKAVPSAPPKRQTAPMNGLTLVAPPEPFAQDPMPAVKDVGASWIAVVPYAFTRPGEARLRYNEYGGQWWGESVQGIRETVRLAHHKGIRVMLKPQVYIPRSWTGSLQFSDDVQWQSWEEGYEKYVLRYAALADSLGVELFCIGTEFRLALRHRPSFWTALISKIKTVYKGKLTYSANWDDWAEVPFWNELDYIGLGGYFPLVEASTPSTEQLVSAWQPIKEKLRQFSEAKGKPVLFTEFGYLSVDGCGWRNWELEKQVGSLNINEQAQANCFDALFTVFQPEPWWAGGFLWKWFPNMRGHEGYPERDYTPQGKLGEGVIRKWYRE